MSRMTIPEIRKAIENLRADIVKECDEWDRNCQACSYERRCGDEVNFFIKQLKDAYCTKAGHDCSKCGYLKECDSAEARAEIRRQKHQKQLDTCAALGSDCTRCEYFAYHCSFDKGHKAWHDLIKKCCSKPYGCIKCPVQRLCSKDKCKHVRRLQFLILERKNPYSDLD